jgi:predicted phosphodiesterase
MVSGAPGVRPSSVDGKEPPSILRDLNTSLLWRCGGELNPKLREIVEAVRHPIQAVKGAVDRVLDLGEISLK